MGRFRVACEPYTPAPRVAVFSFAPRERKKGPAVCRETRQTAGPESNFSKTQKRPGEHRRKAIFTGPWSDLESLVGNRCLFNFRRWLDQSLPNLYVAFTYAAL